MRKKSDSEISKCLTILSPCVIIIKEIVMAI